MPTNPFRRRGTSTSQSSSSSSNNKQQRTNSETGPRAERHRVGSGSGSGERHHVIASTQHKRQSSSNLLLPDSDYRQSLIMPHLTRRFTLLRAPDGSMVTPDAMRAHLRAQRARARATGVPGTQCFLTEEEEDEIIDQLKRQTQMEQMDSWNELQANANTSAHSTLQPAAAAAAAAQASQTMQFGGTDGFGSWSTASPPGQHDRSDSQIDASLTESLGNLRSSNSTSSRDGGAGGFFTSRSSSTRELAYIREVEKSRAARRESDTANESEQGGQHENELADVQEEDEKRDVVPEEEDEATMIAYRAEETPRIAESMADDEEPMPGDFLSATKRESSRLSASDFTASRKGSDASVLTPRAVHTGRQSALLTSLTPEAFNRVSMALEEVYDMVSGHVSDGEGDDDYTEEEDEERDVDTRDEQSDEQKEELHREQGAERTFGSLRRTPSLSVDDDRSTLPKSSTDEGSHRPRISMESETNSYASARSDVVSSALDRLERISTSDGLPNAPAGWQISPVRKDSGSASGQEDRRSHARSGKSSLGSLGSASFGSQSASNSPAMRKANLAAIDVANGRIRMDPSPNASPGPSRFADLNGVSPQSPPNKTIPLQTPITAVQQTNSAPSSASPLSAGFHLAASPGNAKAAAAAATAAGVVASNFVAHAQQQQRAQRSTPLSGADVSVQPTSEVTLVAPSSTFDAAQASAEKDSSDPSAVLTTPTSKARSNAAAANSVLSAGAIAARSPRYFPAASRQSMRTYAAGFHPSVPSPSETPFLDDSVGAQQQQVHPLDVAPALNAPTEAPTTDAAVESFASSSHPTDVVTQQVRHDSESVPKTVQASDDHHLGGTVQPSSTIGLMPAPPLDDAEEAIRWRERYGVASADAHSVRSGVSMNISEDDLADDEAQNDADDDVWARVARNTSPKMTPRKPVISRNPAAAESNDQAEAVDPEGMMSISALQQLQSDLVRSASAKRDLGSTSQPSSKHSSGVVPPPRMPPPQVPPPQLPTSSNGGRSHSSRAMYGSPSTSNDVTLGQPLKMQSSSLDTPQSKLDKARERARMLAEQREGRHAIKASDAAASDTSTPTKPSLPASEAKADVDLQSFPSSTDSREVNVRSSRPLEREASLQSSRSQVLYDVTSSHRPTSPPPRTHKTSLSNLPTLQDLNKGIGNAGSAPPNIASSRGIVDRNSTSLYSMMEATTRVHDQLEAGTGDQTTTANVEPPIPEEAEEYEDVQVEDGFGGFTWERRKRLPRSKSHDVLSSAGRVWQAEPKAEVTENEAPQNEFGSPFTPKSFNSEPGAGKTSDAKPSWSRLPGEEPYVSEDLIDDVAAQARSATYALKGDISDRPKLRTKSLTRRARKQLLTNISQPQLVSTSQRLEHAQQVPKVDTTLRRKEIAALRQQVQQVTLPPPSSLRQNKTIVPPSRSGSMGALLRSESGNTLRSPTSSPTDYKREATAVRKGSTASSSIRRSSSWGNRARPNGGSISTAHDVSVGSPAASNSANTTPSRSKHSPGTPSSERSQTGLGRMLSRFRTRKASDLPAVIEPFPASSGARNSGSMPAGDGRKLNGVNQFSPAMSATNSNTPGSMHTPAFQTPKESPGQFSPPQTEGFAARLPMPPSNNMPLSEFFATPTAAGHRDGTKAALTDPPSPSSLAPPAPIHARGGVQTAAAGRRQENGGGRSGSVSDDKNARDTVVRRTIIVSTYDPVVDERRKSNSTTAQRKSSFRKPVEKQQQPTAAAASATSTFNSHRRTSSQSSGKSRRKSVQDRPSTPPGPDGVSGTHRRKLSQEVMGMPLPPTARNVYEAPMPNAVGSLHVPEKKSASSVRASGVSDYGVSLYDMYIDDDAASDVERRRGGSSVGGLAPPSFPRGSARQSAQDSLGGGGGHGSAGATRHIEVTERADGSVVWQVIAGLADRSSTYSGSIGYGGGGGHSRQTSDTSQYSFLRNPSPFFAPGTQPNAHVDEDGRSLFARTRKGKKSFSIDGAAEAMPPLPAGSSGGGGGGGGGGEQAIEQSQQHSSELAAAARQTHDPSIKSSSTTFSPAAASQPLDFEMATSQPGEAATRIVYTSDAELAAILETLAGPDKSSAKFAFQRVFDDDRRGANGDSTFVNDGDVRSSGSEAASARATSAADAAGHTYATHNTRLSSNGRPVSIWTEREKANDPTGMFRHQRIKIEAEIYSLLQQRGGVDQQQIE